MNVTYLNDFVVASTFTRFHTLRTFYMRKRKKRNMDRFLLYVTYGFIFQQKTEVFSFLETAIRKSSLMV